MRKIYVDGISITLTPQQEKEIAQGKKRIERSKKSYAAVLKNFEFTTKDSVWWEHPYHKWCAEIIIHNDLWQELWMVGTGLKSSGMPGGWIYSDPTEVADELIKALDNLTK